MVLSLGSSTQVSPGNRGPVREVIRFVASNLTKSTQRTVRPRAEGRALRSPSRPGPAASLTTGRAAGRAIPRPSFTPEAAEPAEPVTLSTPALASSRRQATTAPERRMPITRRARRGRPHPKQNEGHSLTSRTRDQPINTLGWPPWVRRLERGGRAACGQPARQRGADSRQHGRAGRQPGAERAICCPRVTSIHLKLRATRGGRSSDYAPPNSFITARGPARPAPNA